MELAGKCMKLIEAMVEKTESGIQESSKALESIVAVAADPETGEFAVRLGAGVALQTARRHQRRRRGEQMLNTVYAWIRKSDEDKLDGMVHILQHLLQCYAARELDTGSTPLDIVIGAPASDWPAKFEAVIEPGSEGGVHAGPAEAHGGRGSEPPQRVVRAARAGGVPQGG